MRELYELRDKLTKELKDYATKELSAGTLTMVDTLAHAVKSLDKVIEACEEEEYGYSSRPSFEGGSMRGYYDGMSYGYSRDGRGSYARGRYARRESMGRYSRDGYSRDDEMTAELQDLMRNAPDEMMRQKIQSIINRMGV